MNREMLKECIADAKTIRETAIASAKVALEEAFTPQLTAMFAEKLNELEEEEEMKNESVNEMYGMEEEGLEEDFNLEEILAELSMTDEGAEMEKEGMYEEGLDEDLMLEEMSDEEIETLVMQVIDDMIASGKLMPGEGEEEGEEEEMEDMEDMEGEEIDEEINLEELLAEMDSEKEEVKEAEEWVSGYLSAPEIVGALGLVASIVGFSASDYIKTAIKKFGEKGAKEKIDKMVVDNQIEIVPFAFMRGRTFPNSFVIVDECQNITGQQTEMMLGRLGKGGKIVFCGDLAQVDLKSKKDSGIGFFPRLEERIKGVKIITLKKNHRHEIVEEILKVYEEFRD